MNLCEFFGEFGKNLRFETFGILECEFFWKFGFFRREFSHHFRHCEATKSPKQSTKNHGICVNLWENLRFFRREFFWKFGFFRCEFWGGVFVIARRCKRRNNPQFTHKREFSNFWSEK